MLASGKGYSCAFCVCSVIMPTCKLFMLCTIFADLQLTRLETNTQEFVKKESYNGKQGPEDCLVYAPGQDYHDLIVLEISLY